MKQSLLTCLLMVCLLSANKTYSQVQADPGVSGFEITDNLYVPQDANMLYRNSHYILRLPIFNSNQVSALPAGSCKLRIGLGSKCEPNYPGMNPTVGFINPLPSSGPLTVTYSQFFTWTATFVGGQWQVTGDLTSPLPADFNGIVEILITATIIGNSTFTANFLVTNHANSPPNILSDEDPTNNSTATSYHVEQEAPVKFTGLDLLKSGCSVKVSFNTEEESNVDHYEIEASKDGSNFIKVGQTIAKNQHLYKTDFALGASLNADKIFVRIKSIDKDGHIQYSDTKTISGICGKALQMNIYPNPVSDKKTVVINATQGIFNGKYKVSIRDISGKLMKVNEVDLNNVTHFDCELGNLAAGKYIIQVVSTNDGESAVLQLQKL